MPPAVAGMFLAGGPVPNSNPGSRRVVALVRQSAALSLTAFVCSQPAALKSAFSIKISVDFSSMRSERIASNFHRSL